MKSNILFANKIFCTLDLCNEKGIPFTQKGVIWEYTGYGTLNSVRLIRMRDNGIPEWLTVPHDLLEKHFEALEE